MILFHASKVNDINILKPKESNHGISRVYFSSKRENTLVYLSNAIEKYCVETNFNYSGIWKKWASYGFDKFGLLRLEEYYPNAIYETYKGVSGYIYQVKSKDKMEVLKDIPFGIVSKNQVEVEKVEYIKDAYDEIMKAVDKKMISMLKYDELDENMHIQIKKMIKNEYTNSKNHPEYMYFLKEKFDFL